jgi:integrase
MEQRYLTLEQLHARADASRAQQPLVYVLGACGFRFGEVAELRWRDVNLNNLRVRISRSVTLVDGAFEVPIRRLVVEPRGIEPLTPALQRQCSTN